MDDVNVAVLHPSEHLESFSKGGDAGPCFRIVLGEPMQEYDAPHALASASPAKLTNTEALGRIIYTDYAYYFQLAGLILLAAMIGSLVLTLRH